MSETNKSILLNAFNMSCVGHVNHGLWTHPRDRSTDYRLLLYWTNLARKLFDGLFLADIVGTYDVYRRDVDVTLRESTRLPVNDPTLLVSAMAAVTPDPGFGVTVNLTYESPYPLARRFSTLDPLMEGRIGRNIVTGYLDSAARAMGLTEQLPHDERYDRADEYLDVLYKLWEGSRGAGAVSRDKAARVSGQATCCLRGTLARRSDSIHKSLREQRTGRKVAATPAPRRDSPRTHTAGTTRT